MPIAPPPSGGRTLKVVKLPRVKGRKLGIKVHASHRGVQIRECPQSSGDRAKGLVVGDMVVEINGQPTFGMTSADVARIISKTKGPCVNLKIFRSPERKDGEGSNITMQPLTSEDVDIDDCSLHSFPHSPRRESPSVQLVPSENRTGVDLELEEFERLERSILSVDDDDSNVPPPPGDDDVSVNSDVDGVDVKVAISESVAQSPKTTKGRRRSQIAVPSRRKSLPVTCLEKAPTDRKMPNKTPRAKKPSVTKSAATSKVSTTPLASAAKSHNVGKVGKPTAAAAAVGAGQNSSTKTKAPDARRANATRTTIRRGSATARNPPSERTRATTPPPSTAGVQLTSIKKMSTTPKAVPDTDSTLVFPSPSPRSQSRGSSRDSEVSEWNKTVDDTSFERLRHLAKTDYSRFSELINPREAKYHTRRASLSSKALREAAGSQRHHFTDTESPVIMWVRANQDSAPRRECQQCASAQSASSSASLCGASAATDLPSDKCPVPGDPDWEDEESEDVNTSFHAFKYKILLTQLEAARSRRMKTLTQIVTVRDAVQERFRAAFGQQCPALDNLIATDDFATAIINNQELSAPSDGTEALSAGVLCRGVLSELDRVEGTHTAASEAVAILEGQLDRAMVAVSGIEVRHVTILPSESSTINLRDGVCHTHQGATVASDRSRIKGIFGGDAIVSVNGTPVLGQSAHAIKEMMCGASTPIDLEMASESELLCALELRWVDDDERCCGHIAAANKWLKQAAKALPADRMGDAFVALESLDARSRDHSPSNPSVGSDCLEGWDDQDNTSPHTFAVTTSPQPTTDRHLESLAVGGVGYTDTATESNTVERLSPHSVESPTFFYGSETTEATWEPELLVASDSNFVRALYADFDPREHASKSRPSGMNSLSPLYDMAGDDFDLLSSKHYAWQRGPCRRAKMERRRTELLQMEMDERKDLMIEWMSLLRARATLEQVDKMRATRLAEVLDDAPRDTASRSRTSTQPQRRQFLRKVKGIILGGANALKSKAYRFSSPSPSTATIPSPSPAHANSADAIDTSHDAAFSRRDQSGLAASNSQESRARLRAAVARRLLKRQQQRQQQDEAACEATEEARPSLPAQADSKDNSEEGNVETTPYTSFTDDGSRKDVVPSDEELQRVRNQRLKVLAAETRRRLKKDKAKEKERRAEAEAKAKDLAERRAEIHRRTALMHRLKQSMDDAEDWIDE